jgi:hypothetical protein
MSADTVAFLAAEATRDMFGMFPGSYRLVSATRRHPSGDELDSYGSPPTGRTGYDREGRMWVLLVPQVVLDAADLATQGPVDSHDWSRSVVAYYGSYSVNSVTRTVTHRVEAALDPGWVGRVFVRRYEFSGDLLTLSFIDGRHAIQTRYQRLPDLAAAVPTEVLHAGTN